MVGAPASRASAVAMVKRVYASRARVEVLGENTGVAVGDEAFNKRQLIG
jgi:hypothetical protein